MSLDYDLDEDQEGQPRKARFGQIMHYLWRRWRSQPGKLAGFAVFFGIAIACDLALPEVSKRLVEALSEGPTPAGLDAATTMMGVFAAIAFTMHFARNFGVRFWIPFAARNMKAIVSDGFKDVQRFSADWHADNFAGATVRRVSRAMWAYDTLSDTLVWFIFPAFAVLTGVTVLTILKWPMIGAFVGLTILGFVASTALFARFYIRDANRQSNIADTKIGAALADAVGANATVKAFGAEAREEARFNTVVEDWRGKAQRTWTRFTNAWLVQNLLIFILQVGLVGLVVLQWSRGNATPGDVAYALTIFFLVANYLRTLGENFQMMQRGLADIEDVVAYAHQTADVVDAPDARPFAPHAGRIAFKQVSFGYKNAAQPLYRDFSLIIEPGETVALVGPTGSGKSTFVKLVQRLYDADSGVVEIDGQDVRTVTQGSLRRAIATVPQDPALFHRSLKENIAYARPEASLEDVMAAAKRARAHDFIMALPKQYDTEVGERGVKLSGGQRQRVALARAFLADAPILVLDEATSSLDVETERDVQAAMSELMSGRSTIVIAHRLSTVRDADRILVFDKGRIVEQGRHGDLVGTGGLYARLHALAQGDRLAAA